MTPAPRRENVFMFSGQGSQYFQMGKELFETNDTFRRWMRRLDEAAEPLVGASVLRTLYSDRNGKSDRFDRTLITHPAIFMVEVSLAHCLIDAGIVPDLVLGASVGSFAAAAVAGRLSVEDGLQAVIRQALALEECCQPGGMTAILADPALFQEGFLRNRSELAAINFSTHFVVAAPQAELGEIEAELKGRGVIFQRLPVAYPFHSQWIEQARAPFASFMQSIELKAGALPMVCCDRASVVADLGGDYFWDVVRRPIRFREATAQLEQQAVRRYIDVGPAGTLATFLKYTLPSGAQSTVHTILTPFGLDQKNLTALRAAVAH